MPTCIFSEDTLARVQLADGRSLSNARSLSDQSITSAIDQRAVKVGKVKSELRRNKTREKEQGERQTTIFTKIFFNRIIITMYFHPSSNVSRHLYDLSRSSDVSCHSTIVGSICLV